MAWATGAIKSRWLFLLGLNVVLLLVGGLVEIYAAIVVVVPLLLPPGLAFGIDPIYLGIISLANMELGFLAPPAGLNLLLASYRFSKPMVEVMRRVANARCAVHRRAAHHVCPAVDHAPAAVVWEVGKRPDFTTGTESDETPLSAAANTENTNVPHR